MAKQDLPNLQDVSRVPEELLPVLHWWQDKGPKTLAFTAAGLLVAAAIFYGVRQREAKQDVTVQNLAFATQAEEFSTVVNAGGQAADLARLDQARALYAAGDYEGALAAYEATCKRLYDPALADIARLGRARTLEALDRLDEALAAVTELEATVAASSVPHYLAGEVPMAKAIILCRQGDKAAAKAALAPILAATEPSPLAKYTPQAERLAKIIEAYAPKSLFDKAAEVTPAAPAPAPEAAPAEPAPTPAQ